jgi:hypothetical protein
MLKFEVKKKARRLPMILIGLIILFVNNPSQAYFSTFDEKKTISSITPQRTSRGDIVCHVLLVSGNEEIQNRFTSSGCLPSSAFQDFSYVDRLPIPESIVRLNRGFLNHPFSVENLLYANLKLANLLNEYKSLRKQSMAVLDGLDVPFIMQNPKYEGAIQGRKVNIADRAEFLRSYSHVVENSSSALLHRHGTENLSKNRNNRPIGDGTYSHRRYNSREKNYNNQSHSTSRRVQSDDSNGEKVAAKSDSIQYGSGETTEIPWLVRMPMSILSYIYGNKIESLIYFLMLYAAIQIIFSSRK